MIAGKRRTKICATKAQAKIWEAEQKEQDWERQETQIHTACLHDIATLYLDFSKSRHVEKTFEEKKLALKRLFFFASPVAKPEALDMKTVLAMLTDTAKSVSNAAANKVRKDLSAYWEFGSKYHGFPKLNPFQQAERFPEKPESHYVPPAEDFCTVYEKADVKDQAMLLTLLHTAGRRSEVLHLTWEDVDFRQRKIRLSTCKTRDGSRKRVWLSMTRALHDALAEHRMRGGGKSEYVFTSKKTGEPYVDRKHFIERLCAKAKVKRFGYHGIRGLSATLLAQELPPQEIQGILRHANLTTTVRYIRSLGVTADRLSETFDRFEEKATAPRTGILRAVK
jgi:integrase